MLPRIPTLALTALALAKPGPGPRPAASLAGLWAADLTLRTLAAGTLTIDGRAPTWSASLAGYRVALAHEGARVEFALPDDAGSFRGRIDPNGASIDGEWIQPPGALWSNRYATPVHLARVAARVWRGMVSPLPERISFYVSIRPTNGGSMAAVIVNPEFNLYRRRMFDVSMADSVVTFADSRRPGDRFTATYVAARDQLEAPLVPDHPRIVLTRHSVTGAIGYLARVAADSVSPFAAPLLSSDGWTTASLADVGIDSTPIAAFVDSIVRADPTNNPVAIHSLLIARHGKLVFEQYFHGYDADRPHDMRSASKTFAPFLAGLAHDLGAPLDTRTRLVEVLRDRMSAKPDGRKARVTLRTLMTMTSGLACDDNDDQSPGNEDVMQSQSAQPDWYRYTLDLPMAAEPGTKHAVYCSAGVNLVGAMVAHATREALPELFDAHVARPLQFGEYHMNLMPTGEGYMGGGLYVRPRDELKLGQLYLDGGMWNGRRVVSKAWVEESVRSWSTFDPQTDYDAPHEYGFGWHINRLTVGNRVVRAFSAGGNGGQIVLVVPEMDLVVGLNGGAYGEFPKWYRWGLLLVPKYVLSAVSPKK